MGALLLIPLAAAVLAGGLFVLQDRLLYFPERAAVDAVASGPLRPWPSAAGFRGLMAAPAGAARATAIVFHGNAGHAGYRDYYAHSLLPLGLRVILAEYPGYGPREGKPSEAALLADARELVALAHREFGAPLLLVGESLGAAVAAGVAAPSAEQVAGLLLITPWDKLANVGAHHYPWLPVRWMLRDGYDSAAALQGFAKPVVVVVAERDSVVPAVFGIALHDSLAGPKQLVTIAGADHNDWPARVDAAWWRKIVVFTLGQR
jgi:hypothetical protein